MKISRRLARRIDRLARAAHRFHKFAHHPLCDRYAGEVVRIGRRARVCRGCAYALIGGSAGVLGGAVLGFATAAPHASYASFAMTTLSTLILGATLRSRTRVTKLLTRLAPAALFAGAFAAGAASRSALGVVAALVAAASVVLLRVAYGRRGADRTPCVACPERELSPCSGFVRMVSRERAFQRVSAGLIARARERATRSGAASRLH